MAMPLIPGLLTQAAAMPATVTEFLDSLAPEDVASLEDASDLMFDGEGDEVDENAEASLDDTGDDDASGVEAEDDPEADAEPGPDATPEEIAEHEAEHSLEHEVGESPDEQEEEVAAGTEDFDNLRRHADECIGEVNAARAKLDELLATASASEDQGGEPDAIEKAIEQADKLLDEIEEFSTEVDDAIDDEDANAAAEAGLKIKAAKMKLDGIVKTAEGAAAVTSSANEPTEEEPTPALSLWAEKMKERA